MTFCFEFQPELADGIQMLLPCGIGSCFIAIVTSGILQIKSKFLQVEISIVLPNEITEVQIFSVPIGAAIYN
jgi:hypothetical protein